jgi:hypothetical protein
MSQGNSCTLQILSLMFLYSQRRPTSMTRTWNLSYRLLFHTYQLALTMYRIIKMPKLEILSAHNFWHSPNRNGQHNINSEEIFYDIGQVEMN